MAASFSLIRDLHDINPAQWNALAQGHPLVSHEYLLAMQQAGCAVADTGWAAHYLLMHRGGNLAAAMPLYLKSHSRGEYVFDMAWARAFAQHGLAYYPKLLGAIPFTPVPGPRLLAATHADRVALAREAVEVARGNQLSSLHILFPTDADIEALREAGFLFRENVQFHWFNRGYRNLEEFLAGMSQPKRKKIRQDRKKAVAAGVTFRWLQGADIDEAALDYFYRCYCRTYLEHGNAPYLNREFFKLLHTTMTPNLALVLAEQQGAPIAAALNIRGGDRLYGRYWGCTRYIPGLHFETCYMQAIEFCIKQGIAVFEGGAQGEHKLSRGMLPVRTWSAHWIRDERYAAAIADYLERETPAISDYIDELHEHSPFKKSAGSPADATSPGSVPEASGHG
ncbi:GNAT family N-acetyltransferase [Candidimonas nitroreducens]|uniref:GNAT family N-acetyltransferase n=1 Tax=Candidimonas nitroreducens TaxID=683354 RepID=UPI001E600E3C|nr:GNAT family N-acetyltransferase [Candidimonas nitroreducens]